MAIFRHLIIGESEYELQFSSVAGLRSETMQLGITLSRQIVAYIISLAYIDRPQSTCNTSILSVSHLLKPAYMNAN